MARCPLPSKCTETDLVHAVVQRHRDYVLDVFSFFDAPQFNQQVMPFAIINPNLGESQGGHQMMS